MDTVDLLAGLGIVIGLVGVVVPILPGSALVAASVLVWALVVGTGEAWGWALVALGTLAVGTVVKYAVPHRRIRDAGVPRSTLVAGAVLGVIGFFVIPVVGLVIGFVGGVYAAESVRLGPSAARPATWTALKAVGLSILIELTAALLAATAWTVGALST